MPREFATGVRFAQVPTLPAAASNPGIVLEQGGKLWFSDGTAWVDLGAAGGGGGVTDHGALTGLADDDHPQYHNDARGDARYAPLNHAHTLATTTSSGFMSPGDKTKLDDLAPIVAGTVTGQFARWNNTTARYEAFDLFGTEGTWTQAVNVQDNVNFNFRTTAFTGFSGQNLGGINAFGFDGTAQFAGATINFRAAETWSGTQAGSDIQFRAVNYGTRTLTERFRIRGNGEIVPGTDGTQSLGTSTLRWAGGQFASLTLNGAAATGRLAEIRTANVLRWGFGGSAAAESGSNAGTDFIINRFDDAGTFLGQAVNINRATGVVTVTGLTIGSNPTSAVQAGTVTGQVALWNQTTGRYEPGSAPPAGAGGSNGQVQYNNAGTIAGMANVTHESGRLVHADYEEFALQSAAVATPAAGRGRIYMRQRAGRVTLETIGPSGVDNALQPAIFNNRMMIISPNTTTSVSAIGLSATTAATLSHPALSSASLAQSIYRTRCATSTTAGNAAGIRHSVATMLRGNATALGGFYFHARVCSGSLALAGGEAFVGLSSSVAALAGAPSALADCVGLVKDVADTAWHFVRRTGTGTAQKVPLTTPLTYAANQVLDVIVFSRPNGTGLGCVVRSFNNAGVPTTHLDTTYTTDIPAAGTLLAGRFDIRNGATAAAADFELVRMYAESDF